ncbi:hypothetical protein B2D07_11300 [Desulfococcus multivorans]|nr:hypothetical protein B2D07_11300 [Desulfococcus multivorans]
MGASDRCFIDSKLPICYEIVELFCGGLWIRTYKKSAQKFLMKFGMAFLQLWIEEKCLLKNLLFYFLNVKRIRQNIF